MAKMRVHELAKELNIESKQVLQFLNDQGMEIKSASSNIEDDAISMVKKKFASSGNSNSGETKAKPEAKSESAAKSAPAKSAPAKSDASAKNEGAANIEKSTEQKPAKKKSNITAVFNAQYSNNGSRNGGRRDGGNRNGGRRDGANRNGGRGEEPHRIIRPRPESERTVRPNRTNRPEPAVEREVRKEQRPAAAENTAPKASATESRTTAAEPERKPVKRANIYDNMPERRPQGNSSRPQRGGNGPQRGGNGPQGRGNGPQRGGNGPQGRGNNQAASDNSPARNDSRRDAGRNRKKNNDRDALGKKQENYINLEKNGGKKKTKNNQKTPERSQDEILTITLPEHLTIRELADRMKVKPADIIKKLFLKGTVLTVNSDVDFDTAEEIALEFNCVCEPEEKIDVIAELLKEEEEDEKDMTSRPPVVCVMGHVDHGKTSLLDAIRDTKVTDREAGGITQKIGAYVVSINGQKITFLDTPGHEAFTAMRMRGANSTDIAILVVAADDGVMPQTVEAINHAKAAGIEIIVAINKIDKPNANIDRVKQELSEYELIPEDWGGSTIFVPVSAHTHEGIDQLLEMILLTAEVLELKANPKRNARGLVIEAELDKGRGAVATVLVQKGTLHVGDPVAAGSSYGKVRAMIDDNGRRVKKAGPSTPVEILGLSEVPNAGEIFMSFDSEKEAHSFADTFVSEGKNKLVEESKAKMSLDDLFSRIQEGNLKELNLIVKADVQGSVEALKASLLKLSGDEVVVKIIHSGVGAITESDVTLASASEAIIIGFNVRPDAMAKQTADREGVDIRLYKVIYNAIEDVEAAMKGMLEPIYEEKVIGHAEVRQIFKSSDVGNIAGSYVLDGYLERNCKVRISREDEQIFEGELASLKRFKDDVKEVKAGYECGLVFEGFDKIQEEDQIEAYIMVEVPRS